MKNLKVYYKRWAPQANKQQKQTKHTNTLA